MYPTTPPTPPGGSTTVIDCQTCPVRGRHCGDCFVPLLGQVWLQEPAVRDRAPGTGDIGTDGDHHLHEHGREHDHDQHDDRGAPAPLDSDELSAVGAFVRAGLVTPQQARSAVARTAPARSATG